MQFTMNDERKTNNPVFYTIGKKGRNFIAKMGKDLIADFENSDLVTFRTASQIGKLVSKSLIDFYDMTLQEKDTSNKKQETNEDGTEDFLFEPNLSELLDFIVTHYVQVKIYQALLETKASEHSARMIAMQNATDNAKELVTDLTLSYNQTRQAGITNELLEITSALAALE